MLDGDADAVAVVVGEVVCEGDEDEPGIVDEGEVDGLEDVEGEGDGFSVAGRVNA